MKKIRRAESPGFDGWFVKRCAECPDNPGGAFFLRDGVWQLTGTEENPTLSPSVICPERQCHYFIRNGEEHHCADSRFPNAVRPMREFGEGE